PEDCLTRQLRICVCRSCQIKSRFRRRLRQVPNQRRPRSPQRPGCLPTWLRPLPAFHSLGVLSFTFWKSTTALCVSTRCNRSFLAARGFFLISPLPYCTRSLAPSRLSEAFSYFSGQSSPHLFKSRFWLFGLWRPSKPCQTAPGPCPVSGRCS